MKILLKRLVPCLFALALLSSSASAQIRVGTVDLGKVFTNYWKFKQASTALDDRKAEMEKSEKDLMDTWQTAKDDYQKLLADANNQAVSADEREKRKNAAEDKLKDVKDAEDNLRQFDTRARATLSEQSARMRDNLVTQIRKAVNSVALEGRFTLVLDTTPQATSNVPLVLYSNGENDLTEAVLKLLNAGAPPTEMPASKKPEAAPLAK